MITGVILFISCHKFINKRNHFIPPDDHIENWKIHIVIGNPFIQEEYIVCGRLIIVKCEDSYLHLLKKFSLALSALYKMYEIEQGVLRCNDDLAFDMPKLSEFLRSAKHDFVGRLNHTGNVLPLRYDNWNNDYINSHRQELVNPLNGLTDEMLTQIQRMNVRPDVTFCGGPMIYLSNKACKIILTHMMSIGYNGFTRTENYGYPYLLEDVGIGFILQTNGIPVTPHPEFWNHEWEKPTFIAHHTNMFK
jgi:hypothetical protein